MKTLGRKYNGARIASQQIKLGDEACDVRFCLLGSPVVNRRSPNQNRYFDRCAVISMARSKPRALLSVS